MIVQLFFINQLREKKVGYYLANPETTPGGRALKFLFCSCDIRKADAIKIVQIFIGNKVKVKIVRIGSTSI